MEEKGLSAPESLEGEEGIRTYLREIFREEELPVLRRLIGKMLLFPIPEEKARDEAALFALLLRPEWRRRWRLLDPGSLDDREILVFALLLGILMFFYLERTPRVGTVIGQLLTFRMAVAHYGVERSFLEELIRDGIGLMEREGEPPLPPQIPKA